jgi:polyferredoxin
LKKERSRKYRNLERLRILSQAVFFGFYLYLLLGAHYTGEDYIGSTVQRFFHFDPLLALVTIVSARLVYAYFAFSLVTVIATVLFGRFFCGWICPLGALHQLSSFAFKRTKFLKPPREDKASLAPKYYILVAVLAGAVFGLDLAGYLDPFSFLTRSLSVAVLPSLAQALSSLNGVLYGLGATGLARSISQALTGWTINTTFAQGFSVGLLFLGAVALNARKERFWCRYLCPPPQPLEPPQAPHRRGEVHQVRPLHPALRDPGPALPERPMEERRVRLLPGLRLDLPDRGHRLPSLGPAREADQRV